MWRSLSSSMSWPGWVEIVTDMSTKIKRFKLGNVRTSHAFVHQGTVSAFSIPELLFFQCFCLESRSRLVVGTSMVWYALGCVRLCWLMRQHRFSSKTSVRSSRKIGCMLAADFYMFRHLGLRFSSTFLLDLISSTETAASFQTKMPFESTGLEVRHHKRSARRVQKTFSLAMSSKS